MPSRCIAATRRAVLATGATMILGACAGQDAVQRDTLRRSAAPETRDSATGPALASDAGAVTVTVYKSPTCGCCRSWVEHMRKAGFRVRAIDTDDAAAIKERYRVPAALRSCHTALVDAAVGGPLVIEGHVPAEDVRRLLEARAAARGLAAPGMPAGAPGMELPDGRREHYDVTSFRDDGVAAVFARH